MKQLWRAAFAVAITGFALVASDEVRPAFAQITTPRLVSTICEQGNLTACGETTTYHCPVSGGITDTYPYTIGGHINQSQCYPTSRTLKYKDFMSSTPVIVVTATRPRCTKTPTTSREDEAPDGTTTDDSAGEEDCVDE